MRHYSLLPAAVAVLLSGAAAGAQEGSAQPSLITGTWITMAESEVTIEPCETGHCGYLSKIVVPEEEYAANREAIEEMAPEDFKDYYNKDEALRDRPLLGLQLLNLDEQVTPVKFKGEVYNPQDGNTYYGEVAVIDIDTIELTGCGFFNLVCKSEAWTRAPGDEDEEAGESVPE